MTIDTFKMEANELLNDQYLLLQMVRRLSSDERNKQLWDIIIKYEDVSLTHRIYINMLIGPEGKRKICIDSFQVPEFLTGSGTTLIVQRCLKLMDKMTEGVDD
jgi:hypothetical protein